MPRQELSVLMNISCWIVSSLLAHSFKVSLNGTQVPLTGNSIGIGSSGPLVDQPEFYAGQNSQSCYGHTSRVESTKQYATFFGVICARPIQ